MPNIYENPQIQRQRQLAEMLMQRGMNPQPVGGQYGRGNALADALSTAVGAYGMKKADERETEGRASLQKTLAEALTGPQTPADGMGPMEDKNEYLVKTLAGNEQTAPMALDYKMRRATQHADSEAELQNALRLAQEKKRLGLDRNTPDPYFSPVQTSGGLFKFDARTGTYEPMTGGDGKTLMPPAIDATVQGGVARARAAGKEAGEAEGAIAKRGIGASEILELTARAKELIPLATSSGVGAMVDSVAGFVGKSPQGADEAAALKVLSGNLVLKQPRMEGPQSDADRKLYAQMAADVGNPSIPASQRMAAVAEIERLNEKYAAFNGAFDGGMPQQPNAPTPPPSGGGTKRVKW